MKLYLNPGACSLASHIALREAGIVPETEIVDLATRRTASGADFSAVNPKGYVPALELDDGQVLTESTAILGWAAEKAAPAPDALSRARLAEMTAFIATEIHQPYMRLMFSPAEAEQAEAKAAIERRFAFLAERLDGDWLVGGAFSPADAFLWVMVMWAPHHGIAVPEALQRHHARVAERPSVQAALQAEGLAA